MIFKYIGCHVVHGSVLINTVTSSRFFCFASSAFESLDKHVLREYKMATEVVPELVASETPFISFLRTADYVPAEAAKRLALYWKYRNEVFEDRWLLPMTQVSVISRVVKMV